MWLIETIHDQIGQFRLLYEEAFQVRRFCNQECKNVLDKQIFGFIVWGKFQNKLVHPNHSKLELDSLVQECA